MDMRQGQLEAVRSFSVEKDLWIADHKPLKFVKHPLVQRRWFWKHSWKPPDPVSPPLRAGSAPGAAHRHDPMPTRGSTALQDILPSSRCYTWRDQCVKFLFQHRRCHPQED